MGWTPISKAVTVVANPKCCVRGGCRVEKVGLQTKMFQSLKHYIFSPPSLIFFGKKVRPAILKPEQFLL